MPVDDKPIRRGSRAKTGGKPGEDEEDIMTKDLADDAVWKRIQQNTFTRSVLLLFSMFMFLLKMVQVKLL